jgi:hypothetical protein
VNLTQNLMLGWPALSKHTGWSMPKMMLAMADAASGRIKPEEKAFLARLEEAGHLSPKLAEEISGRGGNAMYMQIEGLGKKAYRLADLFQHVDHYNRTAMALAAYRAGVTDPAAAAKLIEEAHFRYSKGNRPKISRGLASIATIFRSFTLNQATWMKNQVKEGEWTPLARHLAAWVGIGGVKALPFVGGAYALLTGGSDPEEDLSAVVGDKLAKVILRGAPTAGGVTLQGSVAMRDLLPQLDPDGEMDRQILEWVGGVVSDIPARVDRVVFDLTRRQYLRAIEDASPEALRNPLAAWRLYSQGAATRRGSPLIDLETGEQMRLSAYEAALKAMGFQPERTSRAHEVRRYAETLGADRTARKQAWIDRAALAARIKDETGIREVLEEIAAYNATMERRNRPAQMVTPNEVAEGAMRRLEPSNVPKGDTLRAFWTLYRQDKEKQ